MAKARIKFTKNGTRTWERREVPPGWRALGRDVTVDVSDTIGGGVARYKNCRFDWTLKYDEYLFGLTGTLTIRIGRKAYHIKPGDGLWLPAYTDIVYEAKGSASALFLVYPVNWKEIEAKKAKKAKKKQ
jgi:ethanolamine utilization protein EutQ (cupin superfamily)